MNQASETRTRASV